MLTIEKIASREAFDALFDTNKPAWKLPNYPWGSDPLDVYAEVRHDDDNLYVVMRAYEKNPRITVMEDEGSVHLDSCMEFFFSPCPEIRPDYYNMEANPAGSVKFNYGPGRHGRRKTEGFHGNEAMRADVTPEYWQLRVTIPYSAIRAYAPEFIGASGSVIRANMYRCGEQADVKSFVTLFPILTPNPDYHRPEFFGKMILA